MRYLITLLIPSFVDCVAYVNAVSIDVLDTDVRLSPSSTKVETASRRPDFAARITGVSNDLYFTFTSAPHATKILKTSLYPRDARLETADDLINASFVHGTPLERRKETAWGWPYSAAMFIASEVIKAP